MAESFRAKINLLGVDDLSKTFLGIEKNSLSMKTVLGDTGSAVSGVFKNKIPKSLDVSRESLKELHKESKKYKDQIKNIGDLKSLEQKIEDVTADQKKHAEALNKSSDAMDENFYRTQNLRKQKANIRKEITALNGDLKKAQKEYGKNSDEVKGLRQELKLKEKNLQEVEKEISSNILGSQKLKIEYQQLKQESGRYNSIIKKLNNSFDKKKERLRESGIEMSKLDSEYSRINKQSKRYQDNIEEETRLLKKLDEQKKKLEQLRERRNKTASLGADISIAGQTGLGVGRTILGAAMGPVSTGMDFKQAVSRMRARLLTSEMTMEEGEDGVQKAVLSKKGQEILNNLEGIAKKVGATTSFTATEVADAITEMGKQGVAVEDISKKSVASILNIAKAGEMGLEDAVSLTSGVVNAFEMDIKKDMGTVGDILAKVADSSSASMSDLTDTFKDVAPVAKNAGMEFYQLAGMATLLAKVNIKGSVAGTTMKNAILSLQAPASAARKIMKDYNIDVEDGNGKMRDMAHIMGDLAKEMAARNLSDIEIAKVTKTIAGKESLAGFQKMISLAGKFSKVNEDMAKKYNLQEGAQVSELELMMKKMEASKNLTAMVGATISDDLAGDLQLLNSAWDGLSTTLFTSVEPALRSVTQGVTSVVGGINSFFEANSWAASGVGFLTFALGGLITAGGGLLATVGPIVTGMAGLKFIMGASSLKVGLFSKGLTGLTSIGGKLGGVFKSLLSFGGLFRGMIGRLIPFIAKAAIGITTAMGPIGWAIAGVGALGAGLYYGGKALFGDDEEEKKERLEKEVAKEGVRNKTDLTSKTSVSEIENSEIKRLEGQAIINKREVIFSERSIVIEGGGYNEESLAKKVEEKIREFLEEFQREGQSVYG